MRLGASFVWMYCADVWLLRFTADPNGNATSVPHKRVIATIFYVEHPWLELDASLSAFDAELHSSFSPLFRRCTQTNPCA